MANPVSVACPMGEWTKVATAVTRGNIFIQDPVGFQTYATYRMTGDPAPTTLEDASEGTMSDRFEISSVDSIDLYIWPVSRDADAKVSV